MKSGENTMKILAESWLCILTTLLLAIYSLIIGVALEIGVNSQFAHAMRLSGRPLPPITEWFYALHTDYTHTLSTLAFYPALLLSAYLCHICRTITDSKDRNLRFVLAAFACFVGLNSYSLLATVAMVLPYLNMFGVMRVYHLQTTPPLQGIILIGLIVLVAINLGLLVHLLLSQHRKTIA